MEGAAQGSAAEEHGCTTISSRSWPWPAVAGDAVAEAIELTSFCPVATGSVTPRLISLQNLASFCEHSRAGGNP
jgi:hypothetical protein